MRIVRFSHKGSVSWGMVDDSSVKVLRIPPFTFLQFSGRKIPLAQVKFLSPVVPSKVVLVGLNYRDHARELGMPLPKEPVIFLKPASAVIGPGDAIVYPRRVKRLDFEAELAVVIRKTARNILRSRVKEYILGYTCLNDVTARDVQKRDGQWTRAKSFDTFCPIGPWIETRPPAGQLRVRTRLNGVTRQDSGTGELIFGIEYLVRFVSQVMTLQPGDVISTGTPPGVGPMRPKDRIEVDIQGIGVLTNRVVTVVHTKEEK
ncbi:MAG TPA: fumarylacetoacetate hydrolase family protein [Candidatus Omnitrophota bacterium]|nr:fumarylacetoacetate hydrolase family protein [Candidatus Omnitrophota bacterium]HRZ14319.1 fumarylacetoacetate hydrolase family protein [Candidatus Omnitrophota bacterium]